MATDLATMTDQADGLRDQAWRALSLHPSTTTTLASQLGADAPACIDAAIAKLEHDLRPVPTDETARAEWAGALDNRVRRLAVKVLPTAKPADTAEWRTAMIDALADLPAMVSLTAAKRAIHRPFRFISEIEAAVREIAAEVQGERDRALATFRRHRADIEAALNPAQPALAAPEHYQPIPVEQMPEHIRQLGIKLGHLVRGEDGTIREAA